MRARREALVAAVAALAGLSAEEARRLDPHPPADAAARRRAERRLRGLNPWLPAPALRDAGSHIGERYADFRALLRALRAALETLQAEDFGGEAPVLPDTRAVLAEAWWQECALEGLWAEVGEHLGTRLLGTEPCAPS